MRGKANLICWDCQGEVEGVRGELEEEERGDEGRYFVPDKPFVCPHCGTEEDFAWEEFFDE